MCEDGRSDNTRKSAGVDNPYTCNEKKARQTEEINWTETWDIGGERAYTEPRKQYEDKCGLGGWGKYGWGNDGPLMTVGERTIGEGKMAC